MATDPDVLQLVTILEEEGFGAIAGDLLAEISLGREEEVARPLRSEAAYDLPQSDIQRVAILPDEQFAYAMEFLRGRLVRPARMLAEAEKMAGELGGGKAVPIRLVGPDGVELDGSRQAGDASLAMELDDLLRRLPDLRTPPAPAVP